MQAARGASLSPAGDKDASAVTAPASRRVRLFAAVAIVAYLADVVSKVWAVRSLTGRGPVAVVPGVLDLHLTRNPGAAFSTVTGLTLVLSLVALAVVVVLVRMAGRLRDGGWAVALGLLLAGALGNLTDRVFREPGFMRGQVVDFLELPHWPIFNIADTAISVAALIIVVQSARGVGLDGRRDPGTEQGAA
ncbi:MAG: signal peptidase II [Nocardioidaceae bacterium]